ncbi:uncharacterized protein LOC129702402 [Leucoraja erinacea]|uniref:uncharacterized protein LOC129702402 n=1 Tax=Leucoraja erinaceus TaxID=7782 RepID=UPI0024541BC9|nr:uncharacterized protein LOC129702402 [Leucoraja erinacea]
MGNASSSKQAAQSETPTFFTQEELNKVKSEFETGGVGKVQPLLEKKAKELDNTEVNIAVTGDTGAGKSTFINAMRGLRSKDEGAAAVGTTETTMEPTGYSHPTLPNVRYWDLPGIGSTRFTAGSYLMEMQFKKYDFFIIVSAGRFTESDANLAKEIKRLGKKFYFVRSKIDADLDSMKQERGEFDKVAEMEKIRSDCVSQLGKAGIPDPNVFLISSFKKNMYDFSRLMIKLGDDLPNIKESVFVLALPNFSVEIIHKKGEVLKGRIWMLAIIAGGVGAIPVPGLSAACNIGVLIGAIIFFRECLCLDDAARSRLAERKGKSMEELDAAAPSPLLGKITVDVIKWLCKAVVGVSTVATVAAALCFLPLVGSLFGAGSSFMMAYVIMSNALTLLTGTAITLLAVANCAHLIFTKVKEWRYICKKTNSLKPWMTTEVQRLLKERDLAHKSGNKELYSTARHNLKRGLKSAKMSYKEKIEDHFTSRDTARMWQGIHYLTNLRGSRDPPTAANTLLAEELNHFFARFERGPNERTSLQLDPANQPLTLQLEEVKRALRTVNANPHLELYVLLRFPETTQHSWFGKLDARVLRWIPRMTGLFNVEKLSPHSLGFGEAIQFKTYIKIKDYWVQELQCGNQCLFHRGSRLAQGGVQVPRPLPPPPGSAGTTGSSHRRDKDRQRRRMENASSSQQAAQSETPSYFTQEELNKLISKFKMGGVEKVQPRLEKKMKELDNTELNIAVTGDTGAGKSTLINAMRGLRSKDKGAAAVGTTETTMEPTGYSHPTLPNVRYWDLPGTGTKGFTAGSYLKKMQFKKYDFFIIVSAGRFTDNDVKLATGIKRLGKKFYFVRSKIDNDLHSMQQERGQFDEDKAEMEKIRSDCVSQLGKGGIPDPNVFLISSFRRSMYDFPRLMDALGDGLPNIKESAFILSLPNLSEEIIHKKGELLKKRIWMLAILAGGVGAIPVPGLSAACNMGILSGAIINFRECLCLDDAARSRLAERKGKSMDELDAAAPSPLLGKITVDVIKWLCKAIVGVSTVAAVVSYFPFVGSLFAAGTSFLVAYKVLDKALTLLIEISKKMHAVATGVA